MSFSPTPEQEEILRAATETNDNLLISALAGAAKTTTLVMIANALHKPMLCLAFNKRIALEMQERLPAGCVASTLNSLGHRAWASTLGRRLIVDDRKNFRLLKEAVEACPDIETKKDFYESFSDLLRYIEWGKTHGYIPTDFAKNAAGLLDDDEFLAEVDAELSDDEFELIRAVSTASLREAFQGLIDYSDQLLLPTCFPCGFPYYPVVLVDEAQDLSSLNHAMLRKIAKRSRLIAVGDECQSIYGFRGAHENSMSLLRSTFSMRELVLSTSFRCPISVVREAQWRAPHMRWPSWATDGLVEAKATWLAADLPADAVILCRNNAPLFSCAISLLRRGRYPQLIGNDIGKSMIATMKKLGPISTPQAEVLQAIDLWSDKKKAKVRNKGAVADQAECMRVFAREGRTLGEAMAYAEALLARSGPIKLMTIHKSKGLEFDNVYLLDVHLIRDDQQDQNLKYVAQTRAKRSLTYITSEGLTDE